MWARANDIGKLYFFEAQNVGVCNNYFRNVGVLDPISHGSDCFPLPGIHEPVILNIWEMKVYLFISFYFKLLCLRGQMFPGDCSEN